MKNRFRAIALILIVIALATSAFSTEEVVEKYAELEINSDMLHEVQGYLLNNNDGVPESSTTTDADVYALRINFTDENGDSVERIQLYSYIDISVEDVTSYGSTASCNEIYDKVSFDNNQQAISGHKYCLLSNDERTFFFINVKNISDESVLIIYTTEERIIPELNESEQISPEQNLQQNNPNPENEKELLYREKDPNNNSSESSSGNIAGPDTEQPLTAEEANFLSIGIEKWYFILVDIMILLLIILAALKIRKYS